MRDDYPDISPTLDTESGWYMSSTSNVDKKYRQTIGHIEGLPNIRPVALNSTKIWCLDNSVFTGRFDFEKWQKRIESLRKWRDTCVFVTIPDVVGDCDKTLLWFGQYRSAVNGFPVALVSQDGIKEREKQIPWREFDCLFVGGSDNHKLGAEGKWIIDEAKKHKKWVHVGRVNSVSRILQFWQADSWDGTHLGFMPSDVSKFHAAVLQVRAMKKSKGLFDDLHIDVSACDSAG
jgi:hypothetical protein